jgi:tyrosinase
MAGCTSIRQRKNVTRLSSAELTAYRDALRKIQALPAADNRSFAFIAGLHGFPGTYCPHHLPTFLTWHRAYSVVLEAALRGFDPSVSLPYWDWSSSGSAALGIPKAFLDATYKGADGKQYPNPMRHFTFRDSTGASRTTSRSPGPTANLAAIGQMARTALTLPTFGRFQDTDVNAVQNAHDGLHGWVGGEMGSIQYSAYDPIFHSHHVNVDRLWAAWQAKHGNGSMPASELTATLRPWTKRGADVLDTVGQLCFRYASTTAVVAPPRVTASSLKAMASGPRALNMTFDAPPDTFDVAELCLRRVRFPTASCEARVFVNQSDANATSQRAGNPAYAGSLHFFGHGECYGGPGHCEPEVRDADDIRGPHHLTPYDRKIEVTAQLRATGAGGGKVAIRVIVVNPSGDPVDYSALEFEFAELLFRD